MTKAKRLEKNATIAIFTASQLHKEKVMDIISKGVERLKELGFRPLLTRSLEITAMTYEQRAKEFNELVMNNKVDAIFFAWGGVESIKLFPYIDFEAMTKNPKIYLGHSDPTTILNAAASQGLVTFYGHMAASFSKEWEYFTEYDVEYFNQVLVQGLAPLEIKPAGERITINP